MKQSKLQIELKYSNLPNATAMAAFSSWSRLSLQYTLRELQLPR
jgi:hypothetical protein